MKDSEQPSSVTRVCSLCARGFSADVSVCPDDGTVLTPVPVDPLVGTFFADRYEMLSVLGRGGMGTVYKARHRFMERLVAIKLVHPDYILNAQQMQRFHQEAKAASALSHPNIVTVFDFGISPQGMPYLVMDYLAGPCLDDIFEQGGPMDSGRAVPVFAQICRALAHAHKRGVVHRDLKPSNIVLVRDEEGEECAKLVDFGIAKLLPRTDRMVARLTQTGETFGSPLYMSPEQCMGQTVDERSDIYSLGCLMYQCLTGRPPIMRDNVLATIFAHINDAPPPFAAANSDIAVPEDLEKVVLRCLAKDPAERYQAVEEIRADLDRMASRQAVSPQRLPAEPSAEPLREESEESLREYFERMMLRSSSGEKEAVAEKDLRQQLVELERQYGRVDHHLVPVLTELMSLHREDRAYDRALEECARIIDILRREYGEDSLDLALARLSRADIHSRMEDFVEAEKHYRTALAAMETILGSSHHNLIDPLRGLGYVLTCLLQYDRAELSYLRAVDIAEQTYGRDHEEVSRALSGLAFSHLMAGRPAEAERLYKRILDIDRAHWGEDSEEVAADLRQIAICYSDQGAWEEAEACYRRALETVERVFGPESATAARYMSSLADYYDLREKFFEAESLHRRAISIIEAELGPEHPDLVAALESMAALFLSQRKYEAAESFYRRALKIRNNAFGLRHLDNSITLRGMGMALHYQGKLEEAQEAYQQSICVAEERRGESYAGLALTLECVGDVLMALQRYAEAEAAFRRAVAITERNDGPSAQSLAYCFDRIGLACVEQGKAAEAAEMERRAHEIRGRNSADED